MLDEHVDEIVAKLWKVGGLPVVVPAVDDGRVERALESDVRRGPGQVEERTPGFTERAEHPLTVRDRPGVAGTDDQHWAPVHGFGNDRQWWRGAESHDRAELVRSVADEVSVE